MTDPELQVLTEIAHVLSSSLDLRQAFGRIMQLMSERLGMHRGTLVLLDDSTGRLRTETAYGLSADDIERNRFALGEGLESGGGPNLAEEVAQLYRAAGL